MFPIHPHAVSLLKVLLNLFAERRNGAGCAAAARPLSSALCQVCQREFVFLIDWDCRPFQTPTTGFQLEWDKRVLSRGYWLLFKWAKWGSSREEVARQVWTALQNHGLVTMQTQQSPSLNWLIKGVWAVPSKQPPAHQLLPPRREQLKQEDGGSRRSCGSVVAVISLLNGATLLRNDVCSPKRFRLDHPHFPPTAVDIFMIMDELFGQRNVKNPCPLQTLPTPSLSVSFTRSGFLFELWLAWSFYTFSFPVIILSEQISYSIICSAHHQITTDRVHFFPFQSNHPFFSPLSLSLSLKKKDIL